MAGSFETSDGHGSVHLRPIRVPTRKEDIFREALEMVDALEAWELVSQDPATCTIVCRRPGGLMSGAADITVRVDGPDGIPSSTVHVKSVSQSGLRSRDKANVLEFVKPFTRRVC
jgi:hypothetical protein